MKTIIRRFLIFLMIIFAILGIALSGQFWTDLRLRSQMDGIVAAIKQYRDDTGHLPSQEELHQLPLTTVQKAIIPRSYIFTSPSQFNDPYYSIEWPTEGGWIFSVWRGEWAEYYLSWSNQNSLSTRLPPLKFLGYLVTLLCAATGCYFASRLRFLRATD